MAVIDLPSIHMTHDQLLEALEGRRKWAERIDRKALAKHERDEKAYLAAFRAACREGLKWNYEKVKENYGQIDIANRKSTYRRFDAPACPRSIVVQLDAAIKFVESDTRKKMTLSERGEWSAVYWLLTYDPDAPDASLC